MCLWLLDRPCIYVPTQKIFYRKICNIPEISSPSGSEFAITVLHLYKNGHFRQRGFSKNGECSSLTFQECAHLKELISVIALFQNSSAFIDTFNLNVKNPRFSVPFAYRLQD